MSDKFVSLCQFYLNFRKVTLTMSMSTGRMEYPFNAKCKALSHLLLILDYLKHKY